MEKSAILRANEAAVQSLFHDAGDIYTERRLRCDHISLFSSDVNVLSATDTTPPSPENQGDGWAARQITCLGEKISDRERKRREMVVTA